MSQLNLTEPEQESYENGIVNVSINHDFENPLIRYALVDGMNIAMLRKKDQKGRFIDILKVYYMLKEEYESVEIYVDASIRYRIDHKNNLEKLINDKTIFLCPAGITADELIWERSVSLISRGHEIAIITNDMFPAIRYSPEYNKLKNITVSILNDGEIYMIERNLDRLYQRSHGR